MRHKQEYAYIDEETAKSYKMILVKTTVFRIPALQKQFICRGHNAKALFNPENPHESIQRLLYDALHLGITHINYKVGVHQIIDPTNFSIRYCMIYSGIRILVPLADSDTVEVLDRLAG